ncbi:hypothetical protein [Actinomadura rugatobispora]|uniref:DUF4041 domain-containing protein n=1 Tax=Actinomadura rugatobispora TaxID=1994 RepID=A0ABW1AD70_9ACTN|nr:hypothetical protein GCM10010200_030620 [Actinomadura rugatobispora]
MSTVILVLLCLAIAGRELYLASDKRLPRAQAELRELRSQLAELGRRHDTLRADVEQAAAEAPAITIPQAPPQPPPGSLYAPERPTPPPGPDPQVLDQVDKLGARVDRIETELGALSSGLAETDLDRESRHALARSLDAAEQVIGELRQEMLERLNREEGVVPGLLLSEEGEAEALLTGAFERCAAEYGLRIRIREHRSAGVYQGTAFYLSGRRADALAEELFTYARGLQDLNDPSALTALLSEMAHLNGGGIARIGAFTAVHTTGSVLCGLLPEDIPEGIEPWELTTRLRDLPEDLRAAINPGTV